MPTSALCDDGPRIELPVSDPRPTRPKLAATAAAVPPLDPAGTRVVSYGLCVVPRIEFTVSSGLNANSAMFDLASTIAPAALMRFTRNASLLDTNPAIDADPSALCRPIVSKLSFTIAGTQWSGPVRPPWANRRSSASASFRASGFVMTMALSAGPCLSYAAIRARYASTSARHVSVFAAIAACTCAMVASTTGKGGGWARGRALGRAKVKGQRAKVRAMNAETAGTRGTLCMCS